MASARALTRPAFSPRASRPGDPHLGDPRLGDPHLADPVPVLSVMAVLNPFDVVGSMLGAS
ncbi:hypothetical protein [Afifella sp. YEN Y35]|uniref:hypothetical protein n=1 Tax=Afifella sp. YEN Y35 TaxID=3388337 RepID=UPI0039DFBCA7